MGADQTTFVHATPVQGAPVVYAEAGQGAAAFQRACKVERPLPETVARLKAAIEVAGLWVLHEIDPQMLLRRGGFAIGPARQILFFHPRFVASLLAADPAALVEAPLKLVLLETAEGSTSLRWTDPAAAFARYGHPALAALGRDLAATCDAIVATACRAD